MLGKAQSGQLRLLLDRLIRHDAAGALTELDEAVREGVDAGILVRQLSWCYRDLTAVLLGCPAELMLSLPAIDYEQNLAAAKELGLPTILATMQILNRTETLIQQRAQERVQAELALVQICSLENLDDLSSILCRDDSASEFPRDNAE